MEEYISKSALVAEIDRQKIGYNVDGKHSVEYDTTRKILNILDTLEVKEVRWMAHITSFKAGAEWQFERVKEALLSEVLHCFMHGGEADKVVAKLDEVLKQK